MMKKPFAEVPEEEIRARLERVRIEMAAHDLDCLLITNQENLYYYSGYRKTARLAWMHALLIPKTGQVIAVVPQIMHRLVEESAWVGQVLAFGGAEHWGHSQSAVDTLVTAVRSLGVEAGTIGLEMGPAILVDVSLGELEEFRKRLPRAKFTNCQPMIWKQRMVKTPWEVEIMRRLCQITMEGFKVAIDAARIGATEREIVEPMWERFIQLGCHDATMSGTVCMRGGAKAYDMSAPRPLDIPVQAGRQLFLDGGPSYKGYIVDVQRLLCFGEPSLLQKRLHAIALEAQAHAETALKPGNTIADLHTAAMETLLKVPADLAAQGVEWLYSHTFMGHAVGLSIHEPPWITADEHTVLCPGMILTVEVPALDIPQFRELGGFPEEVYLITEQGFENLTGSLSREMWVVRN